jgi:hypothetical protein
LFSDPQSVTIDGNAKSMPRVSTNGKSAVYANADESYKMTLSHQESNKRVRSMMRLDYRKVVTDPLTSEQDYDTLTTYIVIDRPEYGFSSTEVVNQIAGLEGWVDATSVGKLYGKES